MKNTIAVLLALILCCTGASALEHDYNDPTTITVGIYPYVNDPVFFCRLIEEMWPEDVQLDFVYWDGYVEEPDGVDVLMYDALHTTALAESGWLLPLEKADVEDAEDIISYAWQGGWHNGTLYGIPGLLCAFFLIHDAADIEMDAVDNLADLAALLHPDGGLMVSLPDYCANLYLESWIDLAGETTGPQSSAPIEDPETLRFFTMLADASRPAADVSPSLTALLEAFNEGSGRAYLGFSEHLDWLDDRADQLDIRLISLADGPNVPAFYTDVLSINANITNSEKIASCKRLINLIAGSELMTRLMTRDGTDPQYLLPARLSVWDALAERYALYERMYAPVTDENGTILRFGPQVMQWMEEAGRPLMETLYPQ